MHKLAEACAWKTFSHMPCRTNITAQVPASQERLLHALQAKQDVSLCTSLMEL